MRINRGFWELLSRRRLRFFQSKPFCSTKNPTTGDNGDSRKEVDNIVDKSSSSSHQDAYKQLDNLDFMKAAKILFTDPPKKKKFGLDFHLVQLFFTCLPSLAVYLVAMYARSEMRRMEKELELKKQAEEEAKAKELELKANEEKEAQSQFLEVKVRLEKLEETVNEIVGESKRKSSNVSGIQIDDGRSKQSTGTELEKNGSKTDGKSCKQATTGTTSATPSSSSPLQNQKSS